MFIFGLRCLVFVFVAYAAAFAAAQSMWQVVDRAAEQASRHPYQPSSPLPANLASWKYDDYRFVAFDGARAVWNNSPSPFRLEFFHRGYLYPDEVRVHLVDHDRVQTVPFERRMFQYRGRLSNLDVPRDLGFAGLRVVGKYADSKDFQEMIVFLGASYFRAIGAHQVYGTSARGLAIDIGLPRDEEFPAFREFWIARPASQSDRLTMWARLDGPSVSGAYQFEWQPGDATRCRVRAKLYLRRAVEKIGVAPLTSMWAWGAGLPGPAGDPRPHVHDSDGLLIATSHDEWIWRPLGRQAYPSLSHYDLAETRGFGLMQRDRNPAHYCDDEAKYHLRPSVWVEPHTAWTDGAVELLELPGEHEGIDSIAAWWRPRTSPRPHEPIEFAYAITFGNAEPPHTAARAVAFNLDRTAEGAHLTVDFELKSRRAHLASSNAIPEVTAVRGSVQDVVGRVVDDLYRLHFNVRFDSDQPVELTAVVRQDGAALTETWRYLCPP